MRDAAKQGAVVAQGLPEGVAPVKIRYSFSVDHEFIRSSYGVLNDLVLVSDDELYVTQVSGIAPLCGFWARAVVFLMEWKALRTVQGPDTVSSVVSRARGAPSVLLLFPPRHPSPSAPSLHVSVHDPSVSFGGPDSRGESDGGVAGGDFLAFAPDTLGSTSRPPVYP